MHLCHDGSEAHQTLRELMNTTAAHLAGSKAAASPKHTPNPYDADSSEWAEWNHAYATRRKADTRAPLRSVPISFKAAEKDLAAINVRMKTFAGTRSALVLDLVRAGLGAGNPWKDGPPPTPAAQVHGRTKIVRIAGDQFTFGFAKWSWAKKRWDLNWSCENDEPAYVTIEEWRDGYKWCDVPAALS